MVSFSYSAAWAVVGGLSLQKDCAPILLYESADSRFLLIRDPDSMFAKADEGLAIARLILSGPPEAACSPSAISDEIEVIRASRRQKIGGRPVLMFEAKGTINASPEPPFREEETFIVAFDVVRKSDFRRMYKSSIEAMKVAVAFESDPISRFVDLGDGIYLLNEMGKTIHSISYSLSFDGTSSSPSSPSAIKRISARYSALMAEPKLGSVGRLISQLTEYKNDRLKAFLAGWNALEIFISKSFEIHGKTFFAKLPRAPDQIKPSKKEGPFLAEKFNALSLAFFSTEADAVMKHDDAAFRKLKQIRNQILHGESFEESELPLHELAELLRKYVLAHLGI